MGRPSPLYFARHLTEALGGPKVYLKREDLAHTGAHKINNTLGQGLLASDWGKRRVIAETGAGQHGVAAATVCAMLDLQCTVYMGAEDVARQALNVFRMKLLGAEVRQVDAGSQTLKDAINEALRDWVTNVRDDPLYMLGSVVGPHPYPTLVRDFQSVIGREARQQLLAPPAGCQTTYVACVGGGSNAIGIFHAFLATRVRLLGVEAGGRGAAPGRARRHHLSRQRGGAARRAFPSCCRTTTGKSRPRTAFPAGLDYPGVFPEHARLWETGRARYVAVDDTAALAGFSLLCQLEGIIPALESAHAVAYARHLALSWGRSRPCSSVSPAAATRTCIRWPPYWG